MALLLPRGRSGAVLYSGKTSYVRLLKISICSVWHGLKAVYGPKYKATSSIKSKDGLDGVLLT